MRCQKFKRICPGYRDLSKVRFGGKPASRKGNTPTYEHKPKSISDHVGDSLLGNFVGTESFRTADPMAISHFVPGSMNSVPRAMEALFGQRSLSSMHLRIPEHEAAQCFFLANFILLPSTATKMGHLNFIIPLLNTASERSPLRSAFSAVSLASLGAQPNSLGLLSKAKLSYVQALKQINIALADPKLAKEDSIMATTLLLTVYEVSFPSLTNSYSNTYSYTGNGSPRNGS